MIKALLLVLAALLAAAASLTLLRAPTIPLWKLAILVGEFGHFFLFLPLIVGVLGVMKGGRLGWVIIGLCVIAAGLLVRPAVEAAVIGRGLPEKLRAALGEVAMKREAFTVQALAGEARAKVEMRTEVFVRAGTPEALALDFYPSARREGPSPCVIVIHGGGWDNGERGQLTPLNHRLAKLGYAVAAVTYRLAPQHVWPAQADDVSAAIAYLKTNAGALGIDPTRFVLLGRSAGGQLATAVGYGRPDPAVRGVIALYAPHDMEFAWKYSREDDVLNAVKLLKQYLGGPPTQAPAAYREASAYLIATPAVPPTLMMHGAVDSLVWHKQSERLHARLDELGVKNVFISLPWATHAFDFNPAGPSGQLTEYAVEYFLAAVTK
jgi:acetyl esterase/lipase